MICALMLDMVPGWKPPDLAVWPAVVNWLPMCGKLEALEANSCFRPSVGLP